MGIVYGSEEQGSDGLWRLLGPQPLPQLPPLLSLALLGVGGVRNAHVSNGRRLKPFPGEQRAKEQQRSHILVR